MLLIRVKTFLCFSVSISISLFPNLLLDTSLILFEGLKKHYLLSEALHLYYNSFLL